MSFQGKGQIVNKLHVLNLITGIQFVCDFLCFTNVLLCGCLWIVLPPVCNIDLSLMAKSSFIESKPCFGNTTE